MCLAIEVQVYPGLKLSRLMIHVSSCFFFIDRLLTLVDSGNFLALSHELEMNERLRNVTLLYEAATVTTSTIMSDGYGKWRLSLLHE